MKDLKLFDMDEMDFYLSRCVKNWAASKHPPVNGRARLLRAAGSPPVQRDRQFMRFITYLKVMLMIGQDVYPEREFFGPITKTSVWSFDHSANWRWAF
jgi:hypothetical protein